jgi:uncharacterized phage protein (TIGR01671 family)
MSDREIKFRYILEKYDSKERQTVILTLGNLEDGCMIDGGEFDDWAVVAKSEYTGRKDKNDKEIFEGDIRRYDDIQVCVWFVSGFIWLHWRTKEDTYPLYSTFELNLCSEVIGNIHDNPELLR